MRYVLTEDDMERVTISLGVGRKSSHADRTVDVDLGDLPAFLESITESEAWWSPHVWASNKRGREHWRSTDLLVVDLDYQEGGKHVALDVKVAKDLLGCWQAGHVPGDMLHSTPRGARLIVVLEERVEQRALFLAAAAGLARDVHKALDGVPALAGRFHVDAAGEDPARLYWAPRARVDGKARSGRVLVQEEGPQPIPAATWAARATGILVKGGSRGTGPQEPPAGFQEARGRWVAANPLPEVDEDRRCPACGHGGCWNVHPDDPTRWWCWSDTHGPDSGGCGREASSGRGWFGDALDLEAKQAGLTPVDVLVRDGYLEEEEGLPVVVLPGTWTTETGERLERKPEQFADEVFTLMPPEDALRRGDALLFLDPTTWSLRQHTPRTIGMRAERHVRPVRYVKLKGGGYVQRYQHLGTESGALLLDAGSTSEHRPVVQHVATFPVYARENASEAPRRAAPGWNEGTGVYLVPDDVAREVQPDMVTTPEQARAILDDLVVDFPFGDEPSRQNALALMVTMMMRPCIDVVPMTHVGATLERTGKSKLVRECLGLAVTGRTCPVTTPTSEEEETRKRIDSYLLDGSPLLLIDNLPTHRTLQSEALAALLTSNPIKFRVLGHTQSMEVPNSITLCSTGNNTRMSAELAKRMAPVHLVPQDARPEDRSEFAHPNLQGYVLNNRARILGVLLGAVERWLDSGMPEPVYTPRMGGFEQWWWIVGGIMEHGLGYTQVLTNRREFIKDTSGSFQGDAEDLVAFWREQWGIGYATAKQAREVLDVCNTNEWFQDVMLECRSTDERMRAAYLARTVLRRLDGTPVDGFTIKQVARSWALVPYEPAST